jgi:hypothetical protein
MKKENPGVYLNNLEVAKHVAKAIRLATPGKLDQEEGMATVQTVRIKMRRLFSHWEWKTHRKIHDSMAPVMTPAGLPTPKC